MKIYFENNFENEYCHNYIDFYYADVCIDLLKYLIIIFNIYIIIFKIYLFS